MSATPTFSSNCSTNVGCVKWFNNKAGYGFITLTQGEESKDISKVICNKNIVVAIVNKFKDSLTRKEIEYLTFGGLAITFMQTVRFLTDYLNDDIYYKTNYENQNLVRANNQYQLFVSLNQLNQ